MVGIPAMGLTGAILMVVVVVHGLAVASVSALGVVAVIDVAMHY